MTHYALGERVQLYMWLRRESVTRSGDTCVIVFTNANYVVLAMPLSVKGGPRAHAPRGRSP
jgi:hypothetical protein